VTTGVSDTATVVLTTGAAATEVVVVARAIVVVVVVGGTVVVVVVGGTVVVAVTTVKPSRVALRVVYPALDDVTITVAVPLAGNPVTTPLAPVMETAPDVVVPENV
jgi:hypothetical protein